MTMLVPFEWIAATRFLREGWVQTLLIVVGSAVGVAVIVFMSALLAGLQGDFLNRVLNSQAHVVLSTAEEVPRPLRVEAQAEVLPIVLRPMQRLRSIDQWRKVRDLARELPEVVVASAKVSGSAFAIRGDGNMPINVLGIDEDYFKIVDVPGKVVAGSSRIGVQDILIGNDLAVKLGVLVGDKIRVASASGVMLTVNIAGLFDFGNKGANERNAYVTLRTAQTLVGLLGGVTGIDIKVKNAYDAEVVAQTIEVMIGVKAESWIKTNAEFFAFAGSQDISNAAIRFFVGLCVAFGVASVLVVSVLQKSKEIGILRAMGASRGQILRVFLLQGGIVGFLSSLVGSSLAGVLLWGWQLYARKPDGTALFAIGVDANLFMTAAALATVSGVTAALLPAVRAARLDPAVAIRG